MNEGERSKHDMSNNAYGKQAKYYNRKRGSWQPVLEDLVSKREHHLSSAIDNFSTEFTEKFAMGFTVTKIVGPSVFEVTKEVKPSPCISKT
ncbi:Protein of unknown function [Cotesia congregata]|uniref:Uncharacterized protein n=1 Tax=Cotesia congregata TaxID=51543 RepID=A0A8J2MR06_COTCN|nr:Protein of unknown function [Cotesia congregata]